MSATSTKTPPPRSRHDQDQASPGVSGLDRFAWLMDRAIVIPGTNIRVGLDAIIGLLPFGGDALTGLLQAGLVLVAITKYKVPRAVAGKMIANVLLDTTLGSIPILGDLFDAAFKANTRNVQLLRDHQARVIDVPAREIRELSDDRKPGPEPRSAGFSIPSGRSLIGLVVGFVFLLAVLIAALVALFLWMIVSLSGHPLI